jgi:predicted lipoprotein
MARKPSLATLYRTQMAMMSLAAEANTVIALRTLGMMGLWNVARDEDQRMVSEKTDAFAKSAIAAGAAMARGASPDQIAMAAIRPLRHKTKPNVARLTKAGPKTPL